MTLSVMDSRLTIHQFSRLSGIPAELLRYYDSRDILRPDMRDEKTGYRYYRPSQVARAERIKTPRDFRLKGLQALLASFKILTQPDCSYASRRYE